MVAEIFRFASVQERASFDPFAISGMTQAFKQACAALHVVAADERGREIVARRIFNLAATGVSNVNLLRDRAIEDLRLSA